MMRRDGAHPAFASRGSPTYEEYDKGDRRRRRRSGRSSGSSRSRSSSPADDAPAGPAKVEFITSFGGEDDSDGGL